LQCVTSGDDAKRLPLFIDKADVAYSGFARSAKDLFVDSEIFVDG